MVLTRPPLLIPSLPLSKLDTPTTWDLNIPRKPTVRRGGREGRGGRREREGGRDIHVNILS